MANRSPFYYGWVIWLAGTITLSASMPGQTANVSLFIDQWIADFGLDNRSTISALYGISTFIASFGLTFIGAQLDRFGGRVMGAVVAVLFAMALVYMSFVNGLAMLAVGFVLIRMLGQGTLPLIGTVAVADWFKRLRGRAIAMMLIGFGLFQRFYLPFVSGLLDDFAWQTIWRFLALAVVLIVVPFSLIFLRDKPERFGLHPDGDESLHNSKDEADAANARELEASYGLAEVLRLPIFWVFLLGQVMPAAFMTAIVFHQESLFTRLGFEATVGASAIADANLLSAVFVLPIGALIDRVRPGFVQAGELAGLVAVMGLSMFMAQGWLIVVWVVLFSLVQGTQGVFGGAVWVNLFGRSNQGQIRGFVSTVQVIGTAVGPIILAASFDLTGAYRVSLAIGAVIVMIPLILGLFMTQPRARAAPTPESVTL